MKNLAWKMWSDEEGLLAFEWVLLVTLLTIGIVSGLSAARDAIIDELGDVAEAMLALDQSYTIDYPLNNDVHTVDATTAADSAFVDVAVFTDCDRTTLPQNQQQPAQIDASNGG
ncbi:MAG: hypothetical protein U0894_16240 [Pirellulales bacterium]